MNPKEKALDLITTFHQYDWDETLGWMPNEIRSKNMAKNVVDEITKAIDFDWMEVQNLDREHAYWDSVKNEIEIL